MCRNILNACVVPIADMTTSVMPEIFKPRAMNRHSFGVVLPQINQETTITQATKPVIDEVVQQLIRAPNREQLIVRTEFWIVYCAQVLSNSTYGKGENWYAYWNMYRVPATKPKLSTN